jgi:putative endonuclease
MAGRSPGHPRRFASAIVEGQTLCQHWLMAGGWVHIVTNRANGTLYVGVTSDLVRRVAEHRQGTIDGFTKEYSLKRLVYFERYDDIRTAIQREKNLKHWSRA